jgi:hypothetical protein
MRELAALLECINNKKSVNYYFQHFNAFKTSTIHSVKINTSLILLQIKYNVTAKDKESY